MITSGGPYQTNPEMVAKIRDLAGIVNRIGGLQKLNSEVRWLSEAKFLQDSIAYGPPARKRPDMRREGKADILEPEHSVSPVWTGLHKPHSRQRHRMRTPGSTGAGMGGFAAQGGVGAHRT